MATSEIDNIRNLIEKKGVMFRDFQIGSIETRSAEDDQPEKMVISISWRSSAAIMQPSWA